MNLATRLAIAADRRLTRARVKARLSIAFRRSLITALVAASAALVIQQERAKHAVELHEARQEARRAVRALSAMDNLPEPVALVVMAPNRGALREQLATVAGELDGARASMR